MARTITRTRAAQISALLLALALAAGCGPSAGSASSSAIAPDSYFLMSFDRPESYFGSATSLTVEVAYEPDAEPYTGTTPNGINYWSLLEENIAALFSGRALVPLVSVPRATSGMQQIPAQSKTTWTTSELVQLSTQYRQAYSTATEARLWIVFLKGNFHDGTQVQPGTLGVNVDGTAIIAIFKDVIRSTAAPRDRELVIPKYVEQSTLIHESAHALGLVQMPIPTTSNHHDASHPHHCTNPNCVMYWMNGGAAGLIDLIQRTFETGSHVLFGPECLDDARSYHP